MNNERLIDPKRLLEFRRSSMDEKMIILFENTECVNRLSNDVEENTKKIQSLSVKVDAIILAISFLTAISALTVTMVKFGDDIYRLFSFLGGII